MDNRYYGSYVRYTFGWEYADQEEYGRYSDELDNLELKEIVSDEEYNNNVSRLEATNDMEELERYRNNYVAESEYYLTKEELLAGMKEIEARHDVTEEMKQEDRRMRARYTRDRLRLIKRTYESRGVSNTITNLDVDALSDDDVIRMFAYATHDKTSEEIRELELGAIRDRVGNRPTPSARNEIEIELEKFRKISDRINNQLKEVDRKLVLGDENDLDVTEAINGLDSELNELREMANLIIADMDAFRSSTESADFSMNPREIKKTVDGFTKRFKELKVKHQERYNARVELTNNKIDELKALDGLEPEVKALVDSLTKLERSDNTINSWTQTNYLKNIDFNKLVEVNKKIAEIQKKLGMRKSNDGVEGLDAEITEIERQLGSVATELETELSNDRVNELEQDLNLTSNSINDFRQKLEFNKDKLTEEDYNNYKKRVDDAETRLNELRGKLGKNVTHNNDYKELESKTNVLYSDIDRLALDVGSLTGHITEGGVLVFQDRATTLEGRLNELEVDIKAKKDEGKIDNNQYNSLMNKVEEMKNKLTATKNDLLDPGMVKGTDVFAVLSDDINGLTGELDNLKQLIESKEKPVKREDRKLIDAEIKRLEKKIARLENVAGKYKEDNPEKYENLMKELNAARGRLNDLGKDYRKNCPLMVKAVKSAKNFFKKHKKVCLIVAGLAAFALVANQVLIPAIMHGNIMIGFTSPVLRPFVQFTNKILAGMIGAVKDASGVWSLASGLAINPSVAATSLLKGLAISGASSTALVAPLVVAIKKLMEKMKTAGLKKRLEEEKEKIKDNVKTNKEKNKKLKSDKKGARKADRESIEAMAKLLKEYRKSGKTFDEFASEKRLSEEELAVLKYLEVNSEEYRKAHANGDSGRRGR